MLQRGSLPSEIALQGRSLKSKMVYRGEDAECGLRKTEKIFSANNEKGTKKRGEKWFPEKLQLDFFLLAIKIPATAGLFD